MHRLEVAAVVPDAAAGCEAESAHDARAEGGEDVADMFSATSTPNRSGLRTIHSATASTLRIPVSISG